MKRITNFIPYGFQQKTIVEAIEATKINGGCLLADETGLGKTITASHIAINVATKILVISPKSNQRQWEETLGGADCDFEVCGIRKLPESRDYDCLIVDEAHNFSNRKANGYMGLFEFIYSQEKLPYVLLLSATPINNNFSEYLDTLALIPFRHNTPAFLALGRIAHGIMINLKTISDYKRFYEEQLHIKYLLSKMDAEMELKSKFNDFNQVVSTFAFRNTRKTISENYSHDMELMGHFPKITREPLSYDFSRNTKEAIEKTKHLLNQMPLVRQNMVNYEIGEKRNLLGLGGIYRCLCFKRLESSISAFKKTIGGSLNRLLELEPQFGLETIVIDGVSHDVKHSFWSDYKQDNEGFEAISELWKTISDDDKFDCLFEAMTNEKTVVFTEYIDTLDVLCEKADSLGLKYLRYDGSSNESLLEVIAAEFDANHPDPTNEYDLLLCTDVMSEGTNLHRAKKVFHFDTKWNPSRMIQREGRINRILRNGVNSEIHVYSYDFVEIIDIIIQLQEKIERKMNLAELALNFSHKPMLLPQYQLEPLVYCLGDGMYHDKTLYVVKTHYGDLVLKEKRLFFETNKGVFDTIDFDLSELKESKDKNRTLVSAIGVSHSAAKIDRNYEPQIKALNRLLDDTEQRRLSNIYDANYLYCAPLGVLLKHKIKTNNIDISLEFLSRFLEKNKQNIEFTVISVMVNN